MADLSEQIAENAVAPKAAAQDGASAEQHSLRDQIEADRYLASKAATKKSGLGMLIGRFKPPGTV